MLIEHFVELDAKLSTFVAQKHNIFYARNANYVKDKD